MPVTIRDLAKKLHLSITTVSRALDGYDDVAEGTRKRVIEAAAQSGYEPSYAARLLRRKRTDAIGYILPTSASHISDPFYVNFLTGLCDEAAAQKLDLLVNSCPPDSPQEQDLYRRWVQSRRIDGIIINRTRIQDWRIDYMAKNKIPFVSLGKGQNDLQYPYIEINDAAGVRELVAHLVQRGHRRIAFIGASPDLVIHHHRFEGYRLGLKEAGIPFDPTLVEQGDLSEAGGYRSTRKLLALVSPPTAILGVNDLTALGILHAAKEKDLYIGTELAIAGYDGIAETEYTSPPLTTLYQPAYEIARQLARMLVDLIEGRQPPQEPIRFTPTLIVRGSTG